MKEIKLPKYIIKELTKASDHAKEVSICVEKFEKWVKENVDKEFDFGRLRADGNCDVSYNDELTEIEYGNSVNAEAIERVLNAWYKERSK